MKYWAAYDYGKVVCIIREEDDGSGKVLYSRPASSTYKHKSYCITPHNLNLWLNKYHKDIVAMSEEDVFVHML